MTAQTLALRQQYAMEHQAAIQRELLEVQSQETKGGKPSSRQGRGSKRRQRRRPAPNGHRGRHRPGDRSGSDGQPASPPSSPEEERFNSEMAPSAEAWPATPPVIRSRLRLRDDIDATRRLLASRRKAMRPIVIRQLEQQENHRTGRRGDENDQDLAMLDELEQP